MHRLTDWRAHLDHQDTDVRRRSTPLILWAALPPIYSGIWIMRIEEQRISVHGINGDLYRPTRNQSQYQ